MFSTGAVKPESRIAGIMKTNAPRKACCWVVQIEEINSPKPTSART